MMGFKTKQERMGSAQKVGGLEGHPGLWGYGVWDVSELIANQRSHNMKAVLGCFNTWRDFNKNTRGTTPARHEDWTSKEYMYIYITLWVCLKTMVECKTNHFTGIPSDIMGYKYNQQYDIWYCVCNNNSSTIFWGLGFFHWENGYLTNQNGWKPAP